MPKISQIFGIPSTIDGYEKIILNQDGGTYTASLSDIKEYINIDLESLSASLGSAAYESTSAFDTAGSADNTQAYAIQRVNHTGVQDISTITNLNAELSSKETPAGAQAKVNLAINGTVVSASQTAVVGRVYNNTATATYTDPSSPSESDSFEVLVVAGTATVGGLAYSESGTLITRKFISGSWQNFVRFATNLTNGAVNRNVLGLQTRRYNNLTNKFHTQLLASGTAQYRIMMLGDSWRRAVGEPYWYGRFGIGGRVCVPDDEEATYVTKAGGVTQNGDYASWIGFDWWEVPTSGTITKGNWSSSAGPVTISDFVAVYFAESGGGTFKIQFSTDGSSWSDVSGASYNTDNAGARTLVYVSGKIENPFAKLYFLRVIGVSGTSKIVAFGATLPNGGGNRSSGAVIWDCGEGGSTPANWVAMPQAQFTTAITGFDPDVIFIRGWDTLADWQAYLPTLVSRIRTAKPLVDIVIVGRHPTVDEQTLNDTPEDVWLKQYTAYNNINFIDVRRHLPNWSDGVSAAYYNSGDGVHTLPKGDAAIDLIIRDHIPLLQGARPWNWVLIGNSHQEEMLQNIVGVVGEGKWLQIGGTSGAANYIGMGTSEGNTAVNWNQTVGTGIARMKNISGYLHDGRLGFCNAGILTGIIGSGRFWIGNAGSYTGNVEGGINKNINAAIVTQAPATNVPAAMFGGISGQTADILEIRTGASVTSDGTKVAGVTAVGRIFGVITSYADDAAADADAALPSGGLYRTTAGGRTVFTKP